MAESEEVAQQAAGQEPDVKDKEQGREKHDEKSPDEASERPVRRKLQETRITSDSFKEGAIGNDLSHSSDDSGSERGRLRKKRSIDELNSDNAPSTHRRKRSRGSEDDDGGGGDGDVKAPRETTPERSAQADRGTQNLLSPKKKRSLDQLEKESPGNGDVKSAAGGGDRLHAVGERETKRYRDASQERRREDNAGINAKSTLSSSFLNTSSVSPFASLAGSASTGKESSTQPAQTSSSAFAASSIASFAGSEQSPFGALGSSSTSVFKSASSATTSTAEKPATSGFAAAGSGASPFAPGPSGFATLGASGGSALGKGFGSGTTGKPLTSFASQSGGASTFGGSKETKPFGAAEEESDKEEVSDQEQGGAFEEEQKKDERFYEQQSRPCDFSPLGGITLLIHCSRNWRRRRKDVLFLQSKAVPFHQWGVEGARVGHVQGKCSRTGRRGDRTSTGKGGEGRERGGKEGKGGDEEEDHGANDHASRRRASSHAQLAHLQGDARWRRVGGRTQGEAIESGECGGRTDGAVVIASWKSRIGQGAIWGDQGDSRASVINRSTLETVVLSVVDRIILLQ